MTATSPERVAAPLPGFLVIGAQKSGTTSLTHYLAAHPGIYCPEQPVYFFDRYLDRGLEWYRQQFSAAPATAAVGDGSPNYMYFPEVPALIAGRLPGVRLVAVLRNPVDRAYSHYWHNRTRGHEPLPFADAIAAEPERITQGQKARSRYSYVDRGNYEEQLRRVAEHVPRSRLLVVLTDDLRRDRAGTLSRIYDFVGVDPDFLPADVERPRNPYVVYRSQRLRKPIRRLPGPLRRVAGRLNIRYTAYSPMPPGVREELVRRFEGPNAALAGWLGRDLSEWVSGA
jgi:hypothetical protein